MTTTQHDIDPDLIDRDDINEYGSSVTPTILGLTENFGSTPLTEFCLRTGRAERQPANWRMLKGKALEPLCISRFVEETGIQVEKPQRKFVHPEHPWIVCHIDGLSADGKTLLEVKTSDSRALWDGGMPDYVTAQIQHAAACIPSVEHIYVAADVAGNWDIMPVQPQPELFTDYILPELIEFRGHVQRDEMPPPCNYTECYRAFGIAQGKSIELDEGLRLWIEEREQLSREARSIEAKLESVKYRIAETMRDAEYVTVRGLPVFSRKEQSKRISLPIDEQVRRGYEIRMTTFPVMRLIEKHWKMVQEQEVTDAQAEQD